ncbi:MAG: PEP-CTERM sorting domain-containing protein [Proteobacteria bacterium]|nr:PEP-CTERM sorting domain-containing protein [Pseudomonadota bacterium]
MKTKTTHAMRVAAVLAAGALFATTADAIQVEPANFQQQTGADLTSAFDPAIHAAPAAVLTAPQPPPAVFLSAGNKMMVAHQHPMHRPLLLRSVPEPGTLALFSLVLLALGANQWRRSRRIKTPV